MRKQSSEQSRVIKPYLPPTIPPRASAHPGKSIKKRPQLSLPAYDLADVNTAPPASGSADISSLDTVEQECYRQESNKHVSSTYTQYMDGTKKSAKSPLASPLKSNEISRNLLPLNPLESVRWWLLYPGRIEFLLWSGGTLLLLLITIMLILATMLSLHMLN